MEISLLSTINTNYRVPLEVLISSLLLHKQNSTAIEWHICTDEADGGWDEWKNEMSHKYNLQNATFIIHRLWEISGQRLPVRGRARPIMYARLLVSDILPFTARVIYLDADLLVLRPIEELWAVDLGLHPCACCQDLAIPTVSSKMGIRDHRKLNLDPDDPYFNAGVMVVDIPAWKEKEVKERAVEYLATHETIVNLFDQEALNAALGNDWRQISYRWNIIASVAGRPFLDTQPLDCDDYKESLQDPRIVHYAGTLKPWLNPFLIGMWFQLYRTALRRCLPDFKYHPSAKYLAQAVYDATVRRWVYPSEQALWERRRWF